MTTLNKAKLAAIQRLNKTDPIAKLAFEYFASCQRNRRETTVDRLHAVLVHRGHDARYPQVRDFLRTLADLGCGTYLMGRRGWPSRLQWSVSLVSLGQAATGRTSAVEALRPDEVTDDSNEVDTETNGAIDPDDMKLKYPLRRDRHIEIVLPKDITANEAQRLGDFIKTLQFD